MKKALKILASLIALILVVYLLGPRSKYEKVDNTPLAGSYDIEKLDSIVSLREKAIEGIKPDNQSQFLWADSLNKTEFSVVYLHGFSASHGEAQPILQNLSERFGCNVYLPRLYQHGLEDEDAFVKMTPKGLVDSAREAVKIAKSIGHRTIILSTSTGSTLACYLAANDPDIDGLICTSPNFDLFDGNSRLLVMPWGKQLFRYMMGGDYREWDTNSDAKKYWTTKNRIEGHIALRSLLNQTMNEETFKSIDVPFYVGYYYRDENNMDKIISIDAIKRYSSVLSTDPTQISINAFDNARGHVISSHYMNPNWLDVQNSIFKFCNEVLGMKELSLSQIDHQG